jgi:hypothetical protein
MNAYHVVKCPGTDGPDALESLVPAVNALMRQGYRPIGGVTVVPSGSIVYALQAMEKQP